MTAEDSPERYIGADHMMAGYALRMRRYMMETGAPETALAQVAPSPMDCQEDALEIGMPVELTLRLVQGEDSSAAKVVYKWRPANVPSPTAEVDP